MTEELKAQMDDVLEREQEELKQQRQNDFMDWLEQVEEEYQSHEEHDVLEDDLTDCERFIMECEQSCR